MGALRRVLVFLSSGWAAQKLPVIFQVEDQSRPCLGAESNVRFEDTHWLQRLRIDETLPHDPHR